MLPSSMRRDWPIMTLLAAVTLAVFWQVSRHGFINFDDPGYVTYNPMVRQGLTSIQTQMLQQFRAGKPYRKVYDTDRRSKG